MTTAEKLVKIAENEQKVYEAGQKSEYDAFWDAYQKNGIVYSASYMYANEGWNDDTFKPKHSQASMNNCTNMFNTCGVTDLQAILDRQGVVFDFSKCKEFGNTFSYSKLTRVGVINTTSANVLNNVFNSSKNLHTIGKLILKNDGSQVFNNNVFNNCTALKEIRFEGTIGKSLDLHWSTNLSAESYNSIFVAMSTTVTGQTITFPTTAQATYDAKYGAGQWSMWVSYLSNWTFAYA